MNLAVAMALSGLCGGFAWTGHLPFMPLALGMPILALGQRCRIARAAVAFSYYAVASWPLWDVSRRFFRLSPEFAIALVLVSSGLLASVWSFGKSSLVAFAIGALPPFSLIGWASPLVSSGVLFPGTSFVGLIFTAALPELLASKSTRRMALIASLAMATCCHAFWKQPLPPSGWIAMNLRGIPEEEYARLQRIQQGVLANEGTVFVLPEGTLNIWSEATEAFWQPFGKALVRSGRTIILGTKRAAEPLGSFENLVLVRGTLSNQEFCQRVPVPLAMWSPFAREGTFHLTPFGAATMNIGTVRAAPLICFEQLLVWTPITAALNSPDLLVGITSHEWTRGTRIPAVQAASLRAWSRLFSIPYIEAIKE